MLPLAVLPLAAGAAQMAGAGLRAGGAFAEANAMFNDDMAARLADLQRRQQNNTLGLTDAERMGMENQAARQAGQQLANDQSRQLQQAQMLAGGGAFTGREMFQNEIMTQENQAKLAIESRRQIIEANEREKVREEQMQMDLAQRQSDADAARRAARFNLGADIVKTGAMAGVGMAGANMFAKGSEQMLSAAAGSQAARAAAMQMAQGQMALSMAGSITGQPMRMPAPAPAPALVPAPPGPMSPVTPPMMTPMSALPGATPTIVGYQQGADGTMLPIYAQGGV